MFKKIYRSMNLMSLVTLAITTSLILFACYTTFNNRLEDEVKAEGRLLAEIAQTAFEDGNLKMSLSKSAFSKRVTVIAPDGQVLFDSSADSADMENHLERPEIKAAFENGEGQANRFSATRGSTTFYYAVKLDNGCVLRIADETHTILTMFSGIIIPIIVTVLFIYFICIFFAKNITHSIIRPINKINLNSDDYTGVYEELVPFLKRISGQNKEIAHQVQKVKREELKLETISDNMNEGLIVLDKNAVIISANNSAAQLFGVSRSVLSGTDFGILAVADGIRKNIDKALGGEKCHEAAEINGKVYQIFYSPIMESKNVRGIIMLMFDISDEMKAEQIRREFSANVSHELKTPLTTILGYSQIINNDIAKAEDVKSFTGKIEKEATRLITLIDDIIKLSRLDEQQPDEEKTQISIKEVVNEVVESLSDKAAKRGITFTCDGGDFSLYANPRQIAELVYNLCDNAVKYNKDNGSVTIRVKDKSLIVADTGIGIPNEHLDRIFERFYRVDKSRSRTVNGTGLGLSIVKHIAIQNGADVDVKSNVGQGTVFTVSFDRKEE